MKEIIKLLKENWSIIPHYFKVSLLCDLNRNIPLLRISKLIGRHRNTLLFYVKDLDMLNKFTSALNAEVMLTNNLIALL